MALEQELDTYRTSLPGLLRDAGKFVLIHGTTVAGVYGTYAEAITSGYEQFDLSPFLAKKIEEREKVHFIRPRIMAAPERT